MAKLSPRKKAEKQEVINAFAKHKNDVGSHEVQIALMQKRVSELQEHCFNNQKDFSAVRCLQQISQKIKRFNKYLKTKK